MSRFSNRFDGLRIHPIRYLIHFEDLRIELNQYSDQLNYPHLDLIPFSDQSDYPLIYSDDEIIGVDWMIIRQIRQFALGNSNDVMMNDTTKNIQNSTFYSEKNCSNR